jgi:trehalose 6-phosphate synthase
MHSSTPRRRLADIYRSSRIGMVTPLRDGMNLVAKEYVAAQDPADPGVLILSRFAGAAEDLTDALIVNPYSIDTTADVIRQALEMSLSERRARHQALMTAVQKQDIAAWYRSYLAALEKVRMSEEPPGLRPSKSIQSALARLQKSTASRPLH